MSGFRVPTDVAWVTLDEPDGVEPETVVARVPTGPPYALRGPSALIWGAAVQGGDEGEVIARVAALVDQPVSVVADDVNALLTGLIDLALLQRD